MGPENGGFSQKWGSKYYFLFSKPPKNTSLRGTASFDVFCVKISFGPSAVASLKNQKNEHLRVIFHAYGEKKPLVESAQNFALGRYPERNHRCKFGGRSVEPFCVARGQILGFSIGFRSRPYNTLALPCECVMFKLRLNVFDE